MVNARQWAMKMIIYRALFLQLILGSCMAQGKLTVIAILIVILILGQCMIGTYMIIIMVCVHYSFTIIGVDITSQVGNVVQL